MTGATRDLHLLVTAVFLSSAGDMLALLTLALLVHDLTGSGLAVAGLFAMTMVPMIALAPIAGSISDRVESVRLIRICSLFSVPVAFGLALTGSLPVILALTATLTAVAALSQPAEFALLPKVAEGVGVTRANGLVETARYAGFTLGPLLAGGLVAVGSVKIALLANGFSFLAISAATFLIRARREPAPAAFRSDLPRRSPDGLSSLWADGTLRTTVIACTAALLFLSGVMTIEVFFIKDVLGSTDAAYAGVTAAWMAGMVFGATTLSGRMSPGWAATAVLAGLGVQGLGMGTPALLVSLPALAAGFMIGGVGHGLKNTMMRTLMHQRVPQEKHGRAFAAYNGLRNSAEVIALAGGGTMVALIGPQLALLLAGIVPLLIAVVGLAVLLAPRRTARVIDLTVSPSKFS